MDIFQTMLQPFLGYLFRKTLLEAVKYLHFSSKPNNHYLIELGKKNFQRLI